MNRHSPLASILGVALLSVSAGCGHETRVPTAPTSEPVAATTLNRAPVEARGLGSFYPLDIGNYWRYAHTSTKTVGNVTKSGHSTRETTLAREVTRYGRPYIEERITFPDQPQAHFVRWLRQDRSGLLQAGPPSLHAPPDYEQLLLAYPLHRGKTWILSEFPRITADVEGIDVLDTPAGQFPAWRIRLRNSGHDPHEEHFVWYGRVGYLGMKRHLEFERPDRDGNLLTIIDDEAEWLESTSLGQHRP